MLDWDFFFLNVAFPLYSCSMQRNLLHKKIFLLLCNAAFNSLTDVVSVSQMLSVERKLSRMGWETSLDNWGVKSRRQKQYKHTCVCVDEEREGQDDDVIV